MRRLLCAAVAAALVGLVAAVAIPTRGAAAAPTVPRYDHVFLVVEENHSFGQIMGNPMAPNINRLASAYGLATQYFGVANPSAPNYVAMLGGSTFGVHTDDAFRIRSLIERWNGSSWSIVPSPDPGSSRDTLFGVAALSDRDVWAVGGSQDSVEGPFHTLVEHWDGARWSVVPSPNPGPHGDELFGVSAASPDDVWAVGQQQGGSFPSGALVEHWDGTRWRVADSPTSSSESDDPYAAVAGTWAVGDRESDQSPQRTLALNLATGQVAATPDVGAGENDLYAATAKGGAVWAAGRVTDPANDHTSTLVERLHDGSWAVVPTPNPGGNSVASGFGGVTATSPAAAWAVGSTNDGGHAQPNPHRAHLLTRVGRPAH